MILQRHRSLRLVLFCVLAVLLSQCASAVDPKDPVGLTRIDPGGSYSYREARWSPDSTQIVYARREVVSGDPVYDKSRTAEIFVMDVSTHATKQLTNNAFDDFAPAWSLDGKRIAYIHEETHYDTQAAKDVITDSIRIINSDGTDDKEIFACAHGCGWLSWSPTGDQIALQMQLSEYVPGKTVSGPPAEIFLIKSDGSDLVQVTKGDNPALKPQWSPDGRYLVFLRYDQRSIKLLDIDNHVETSLAVGELIRVEDPSWSRDQSGIVFSAMRAEKRLPQLYFLRLADGSISPVFDKASNLPELYMYGPEWSPDGTKLIFNEFQSRLYLADPSSMRLYK